VIPGNRQRNYLQSALYVAIAGVLAALLLERLLTYAEVAEKAAVDATVSQVQAAIYAKVAFLALRGNYEAIDALPTQNPFQVADVRSANYLGEFDGVPPGGVEGGNWFFDRSRHELVYVPNLRRYLTLTVADGPARELRYRLEVRKTTKYGYSGVALLPVGKAIWVPSP
jgi:hypothetical protein